MPTVALVTCVALPELDPDEARLLTPLRDRGIVATPAIWNDQTVVWDAFDLTVIRCPWDYSEQRDHFLDWAHRVPRLCNSAELVEWNTDKRYLADLAAEGVPVVPTTWIPPGTDVGLPTHGEWVLKPSIGAGSRGAGRYRMDDTAQAQEAFDHLARLHRSGATAMAQPYIAGVDVSGERALIYIDGRYSHTITKGPMLTGPYHGLDELYKAETISDGRSSAADRELAKAALTAIPTDETPLYARIDLVDSPNGTVVLELEVAEPSLFFGWHPPAAANMAEAIARRLYG